MKEKKAEYEIIPFKNGKEFRTWLHKYHKTTPGVWLKLFKKNSGKESVTYASALDEALCYGWIDGQSKGGEDDWYLQKFTPRRPKGLWSQRNREHIARLTKEGKMQPAGQAEVDAAKADGRWDAAYAPPSEMEVPTDFIEAVKKDKKAYEFFQSLNRTNLFAICFQLATAKKPETRQRRFEKLLILMKEGKKLH